MNCLRYWARYVRKGKVKSGGIKNGNESAPGGALGLNTLCRGCSSHTTLVGLLYLGGDKLEKVCTGYKI